MEKRQFKSGVPILRTLSVVVSWGPIKAGDLVVAVFAACYLRESKKKIEKTFVFDSHGREFSISRGITNFNPFRAKAFGLSS